MTIMEDHQHLHNRQANSPHTHRRMSTSSSMPVVSSTPMSTNKSNNALHQLLSPDGYYTYLQIPKSTNNNNHNNETFLNSNKTSTIPDKDLIIKNYRKLSLKHHPDRKGGDTETFRVLNRAKRVLTHAKLRQQYDLLGLDLEDDDGEEDKDNEQEEEDEYEDEDDEEEEDGKEKEHKGVHEEKRRNVDDEKNNVPDTTTHSTNASSDAYTSDTKKQKKKRKSKKSPSSSSSSSTHSSSDTVLNQLASTTLAFLFQLAIRTTMMGFVSIFISRFLWTLVPFELLLLITALRIGIDKRRRSISSSSISWIEILSPLLIALGVFCMYYSRISTMDWGWTFWFGETLVMSLFIYNSLFHTPGNNPSTLMVALKLMLLLFVGCSVLTFILRGYWGRYAIIVGIQLFLALIAVVAFPMMEMLLEQIVQEKLRKIGDKIRSQAKRLDELRKSENEPINRAAV